MRPSTRWHAALGFALVGEVPDGLPEPGGVDLDRLLVELDRCWPGGLAAIRADLARRGINRLPVRPLPDDLRAGLSPAQLAAAVTALQQRMGLTGVRQVAPTRPLDAEERRLQAEVPPHHG